MSRAIVRYVLKDSLPGEGCPDNLESPTILPNTNKNVMETSRRSESIPEGFQIPFRNLGFSYDCIKTYRK